MSGPVGRGRRAESLGDADPRSRRHLAAPLTSDAALRPPLRYTRDGRLGLKPARTVARFEAPTTPAEERVNEIIAALREQGLME